MDSIIYGRELTYIIYGSPSFTGIYSKEDTSGLRETQLAHEKSIYLQNDESRQKLLSSDRSRTDKEEIQDCAGNTIVSRRRNGILDGKVWSYSTLNKLTAPKNRNI